MTARIPDFGKIIIQRVTGRLFTGRLFKEPYSWTKQYLRTCLVPAPLGARANSTLFSPTNFLQLASVPTSNGGWMLTLWCFPISEPPRPSFGVGLRIFAEWIDFATQKLTSKPGTVYSGRKLAGNYANQRDSGVGSAESRVCNY